MMTRLTIYLAALMAAVAVGCALGWSVMHKKLAAKEAEVRSYQVQAEELARQRKTDMATLASLAKKNAAAARKSASARQELRAAAASAPQWANEELPKEVMDALSH